MQTSVKIKLADQLAMVNHELATLKGKLNSKGALVLSKDEVALIAKNLSRLGRTAKIIEPNLEQDSIKQNILIRDSQDFKEILAIFSKKKPIIQ